ncbi:MAG: hypothetical protein K9M10_01615 [Candidatus Pacebacteria bacterium]|nr:hypothetical protein [Candidatus Paceibacterota bacterium]MCF7857161.1 hypothetical protein [Candidatus Paceibacterota bacterium]
MGGNSTLQSAVVHSGKAVEPSVFDLQSWQGLTEVLRTAKEKLTDASEYSDFRDLILQYAQHGGDAELKKQISVVIAKFGKTNQNTPQRNDLVQAKPRELQQKDLVQSGAHEFSGKPNIVQNDTQKSATASDQKRSVPATSSRRLQPTFGRVQQEDNDTKSENGVVVLPNDIEQQHHESANVLSESDQLGVNRTTDITAPVVVETKVEEAPKQIFRTLEEHKTRISEIKRIVNEHYGNPVALVDPENVLGRAYMTALLGALKATGGNGTEGVDGLMNTLENAFQELIKSNENKKTVPEIRIHEVKKEEVASEYDKKEEIDIASTKDSVIKKDIKEVEPQEEQTAVKDVIKTSATPMTTPPSINAEEPSQEKTNIQTIPSPASGQAFLEDKPAPVTIPENIPEKKDNPFASFPKEKEGSVQNNIPPSQEIKQADSIKENITTTNIAAPQQSDLVTPEISTALNQLLHEWSIFDGSGLFGTGPGGSEHPLYLKLASLSMGEVVSGRWEGSDPKTLRAIKEYVDAWRHEQGIAYTIAETFEHYLRRVLQRILKRRNV